MTTGEPDNEALRALFTELEFTTLLKELAPSMELHNTDYREIADVQELEAFAKTSLLAIAVESSASVNAAQSALNNDKDEEEIEAAAEEEPSGTLTFPGMGPDAPDAQAADASPTARASMRIGLAAEPGKAAVIQLEGGRFSAELKQLLGDAKVPKRCTTTRPRCAHSSRRALSWPA